MTSSARPVLAAAQITVLPGVPLPPLVQSIVETLLEPLASLGPLRISDGPQVQAGSDLAEFLADRPSGSFDGRGARKCEFIFRWQPSLSTGTRLPSTGKLTAIFDPNDVDIDEMVDRTYRVASVLEAPLAVVERAQGPFNEVMLRHARVYQDGREGADRRFGVYRGMSGLAWRTFLGPSVAEMFEPSRLETTAKDLGDGCWAIELDGDIDSSDEALRSSSHAVQRDLGTEFFFDAVTEKMPDAAPELPLRMSCAIRVSDRTKRGDPVWRELPAAS